MFVVILWAWIMGKRTVIIRNVGDLLSVHYVVIPTLLRG